MAKLLGFDPTGKQVLIDQDLVGGSNVIIVNVDCETDVYVGSAVIMQASGVAKNGLADSLANSNIIGIVESKSAAAICNIRVLGVSLGVFAGLDVTKEYYLSESTPGGISTSVPVGAGSIILKIGQPFSSTKMLVSKGQRIVRA